MARARSGQRGKSVGVPIGTLFYVSVLIVAVGWFARVAVHELGHAAALAAMGVRDIHMDVNIFHGFVSWSERLPVGKRAVVALAGSWTVAAAAYFLAMNGLANPVMHRVLQYMAVFWIATEFVNMAPRAGTDGGYLATVWGAPFQWFVMLALGAWGGYLIVKMHISGDRALRVTL